MDGSSQPVAYLQRMAAEEIGGGKTLAAFDLDFEEVEKAGAATDEDAAGIGADDGAGRGAYFGVFDGGAVNF
jgi:hypothetical protein